jgi:hypothetical protein
MFLRGSQAGRRGRAGLAVCALAGLTAVAGCTGPSASTQAASAERPEASWAAALGSGLTVDSPGSASPGNDSPQGVMIGVATDYSTGQFADLCTYDPPSQQSGCLSSWMGSPSPGDEVDLAQMPTGKNVKPGYTAIDGSQALVSFTGTVCVLKDSPSCFTNHDPAAILDSGKSFSQLWWQRIRLPPTDGNFYSLSPAVKVHGKWYATADTF